MNQDGEGEMMTYAVWLVAVIHVAFAGAEIFRWPNVSRLLLGYDEGMAAKTAKLGLNQGAYNAFFAIVLLAVLLGAVPEGQAEVLTIFCLASLAAAGLVGLLTIRHWVFLIQLVPAAVALWLVLAN